jgi:glutamate 5-kinase
LPKLQAASALGQARLQQAWERALAREGVLAAQILLTAADVGDRAAYVNARNAAEALFALGAVPIVNENDATATDEIAFGDNDALAAHVAILVRARLLVLLTEVDGVHTRAPGTPGAEVVREGSALDDVAFGDASQLGRGGMKSKVVAAHMASEAGIPTVIAEGTGPDVLGPILAGEPRGTRFHGGDRELSAYKLWLRFAKEPVGALHVDDGARRAVVDDGRSLLAVGVTWCEGRFDAGDAVELVGPDGVAFARGVAGASASEIAERSPATRPCTGTGSSCTDSPWTQARTPRRPGSPTVSSASARRPRSASSLAPRARARGARGHPPRDRRARLRHAAPHSRGGRRGTAGGGDALLPFRRDP